jgi:hypothetical protein
MSCLFAFLIAFDVLGSYDPDELYQALLVDAKSVETAGVVLDAAHHDHRVTPGQFNYLHDIYILNYVD